MALFVNVCLNGDCDDAADWAVFVLVVATLIALAGFAIEGRLRRQKRAAEAPRQPDEATVTEETAASIRFGSGKTTGHFSRGRILRWLTRR